MKIHYKQLQIRAARHGVSMEEEVRQIIYHAMALPEQMSAVFKKNFGTKNGVNLDIKKQKPHEPMDFE